MKFTINFSSLRKFLNSFQIRLISFVPPLTPCPPSHCPYPHPPFPPFDTFPTTLLHKFNKT